MARYPGSTKPTKQSADPEQIIERTKRLDRYVGIGYIVGLGAMAARYIVTNYDRIEPIFGAFANSPKQEDLYGLVPQDGMFRDRMQAGTLLSQLVLGGDVVCAIPRGGVPVAAPIAEKLGVPLSIIAVKKITNPADPEYALGATGSDLVDANDRTPKVWIDSGKERARKLEERFGSADLESKHVVLVDDGAATGRTFLLAIDIARSRGASKVTVALPIASAQAAVAIKKRADASVILEIPESFAALSRFYEVFDQTSDEEVSRLLEQRS